jgi:hypothetical protein
MTPSNDEDEVGAGLPLEPGQLVMITYVELFSLSICHLMLIDF